jgi:hypothetical protein
MFGRRGKNDKSDSITPAAGVVDPPTPAGPLVQGGDLQALIAQAQGQGGSMVVSGGDGGSDIQSLLSQLGAAGGVHQVVMGSNVTFTQAGEAGMNMSDMVAQAVQGAMAGLASARNDPKWQVPEDCPNCGARVDQATACHEDNPLCGFCHAPIPVQPYESHNMSGVAAGLGQVAAQQADPSLGGTARIIATGSPVQTQLVAVTPMPGVRNAGGQDVTGLTLNVTPPNGAPYQVLMGLHVPPEAEHLLVPGATLPGKALPAHPEAVAIDWDAALVGGP